MDRYMLKLKAKQAIFISKPSPLIAGLIFTAILFIMYIVQYSSGTDAYAEIIASANNLTFSELITKFSEAMTQDRTSYIVNAVFTLINLYVSTGIAVYSLKIASGERAVPIQEMFPPITLYLKYVLLSLLMGLFIVLWSFLLIIPGIIAALNYSQAKYILIEHPDMSVLDCVRESKRLMKGRKGEYFVLSLSFIGWNMLTSICVVTGVWTYPYQNITMAMYYRELTSQAASSLPRE